MWVDSLRQSARRVWQAASDFLYPPFCPLCRRPQQALEWGRSVSRSFCGDCRSRLAPQQTEWCPRCAAPRGPYLENVGGCHRCRDDSFAFAGAVTLGIYERRLREVCLRMKRGDAVPLACACGELLWEYRTERLREFSADAVVSVPKHWTRRFWRPADAAAALGRFLAGRLNRPFERDVLRKVRWTRRQFSLPASRRRTNLRKAFAADLPADLRSATILVVDDVLTTGATAHAAAKALRAAGARRVFVAVLARGLGH